jgi:aminopeptidase
MAEQRLINFAKVLVDFCTEIQPGDRVLLQSTTLAEELVRELYVLILERGGHPYIDMRLPERKELKLRFGNDEQLKHTDQLVAHAYENFESRIRIWAEGNTKANSGYDAKKQSLLMQANTPILNSQFERGGRDEFKWVTTMFPTRAYAQQADMGFEAYKDFFYGTVHANEAEPVKYWKKIKTEQQKYVDALKGHDKVELRGPNVDLTLSIKGRTFINSFGVNNMPSGEVFTGPIEDSVNGWVRYTYPAQYRGNVVEGAELKFKDGKVVEAKAEKNQEFMQQMLNTDKGASYVGEFAIGLNEDIDRFTGFILLDEKIGGSFHMALGKGYPETGSKNDSAIHWDMICDLRTDSEILVDGETFYKNGKFVI